MSDYPSLEQFVAGYLHQDWQLDYADEWEALDDFVLGQTDLIVPLAREVDEILATKVTEEDLVGLLIAHGADYVPTGPDGSARTWLREVRERIGSVGPGASS